MAGYPSARTASHRLFRSDFQLLTSSEAYGRPATLLYDLPYHFFRKHDPAVLNVCNDRIPLPEPAL